MPEPFDLVRRGYDRIRERYRDWSSGSAVRLEWLRVVLDELQPGAIVIDLGCGPGEPATRLLAESHRVIGVDASQEQLRLARSAAPAALLVQADMTRFRLRPQSVDAVVSFYALGHVPAERHAPLFDDISRWLRPGGLLLTSAPVRPGDSTAPDWLGVPMFFGGIGVAATRQAIADAGLHLETLDVVDEDEGDGRVVSFLWLIARKPMASDERAGEVESVLQHLRRWARRRSDVRALALVGSWARGAPHDGSDVDVVLLTDSPEHYIDGDGWLHDVGGVRLIRTLDWGPVTERRFALASGLEVELDVGTPGWASVDPVDGGTRRVVTDGMRVLFDPDGLLARLAAFLQPDAR